MPSAVVFGAFMLFNMRESSQVYRNAGASDFEVVGRRVVVWYLCWTMIDLVPVTLRIPSRLTKGIGNKTRDRKLRGETTREEE